MKTIINEELGVALDVTEDGHNVRSIRPCYESMMSDDRVWKWVEETLQLQIESYSI